MFANGLDGSELCHRNPQKADEYAKAILEVVEGSEKQLKDFSDQRDRAQAVASERGSGVNFSFMNILGTVGAGVDYLTGAEKENDTKKKGDTAEGAQEEDSGMFSWLWGSSSSAAPGGDTQGADSAEKERYAGNARLKRSEQSSSVKGPGGEQRPQEAVMLHPTEDLKYLRSLSRDELDMEVGRRTARMIDKKKVLDTSRSMILGVYYRSSHTKQDAGADEILAEEDNRRMISWMLYTSVQKSDIAAAKAAEALGYLTRKAVVEIHSENHPRFTDTKEYQTLGIESYLKLAKWHPPEKPSQGIASILKAGWLAFGAIDVHGEVLMDSVMRHRLSSLQFIKELLCVQFERMPNNLVRHTQRLLARVYEEEKKRPLSKVAESVWPEDVSNGIFKPQSNNLLNAWVCEVLLNALRTSHHAYLDAMRGLEASMGEPLGTTYRASLVKLSDLAVLGHRAAYERMIQEGFVRRNVPWYTQVLVIRELSRQVPVHGMDVMERLLNVLMCPDRDELQQAAYTAILDAFKAAPPGDTSLEEATSTLARAQLGSKSGLHLESGRLWNNVLLEAQRHREKEKEKSLRRKTWQSKTKVVGDHRLGDEAHSVKKERARLQKESIMDCPGHEQLQDDSD